MSRYNEVLKQYWGYSSFRPLQEEIIASAMEGKDTLALMPTGGGKSITFQVPALAEEGICLVITPLIALMKDQVENLRSRKIKAMAIHSGMTRDEISIALDNCIFGDYKFLYLSPERLFTEIFRVRVRQMNVNLIAVDEAHCISQWGYDFRPSYLRIASLRELLPDVPVLALTATATKQVAEDIMDRLEFRQKNILKKSFKRDNLAYIVRSVEDKPRELLKICKGIDGSGIVYVRNRRNTSETAKLLAQNGIVADHYHAGLKYNIRATKQEEWQKGKTRVMVSTNAFGMGIDKPDVRFVVHMNLTDSPEAYFQEAGRAGRDEKKAWAILLYNGSDRRKVEQRIAVNFPSFNVIKEVYNALFNHLQIPVGAGKGLSMDFILGEFLSRNKFNAMTVTSVLNILSREGYLEVSEEINNPSRIHFLAGRDELYGIRSKNLELDEFIKLILRSYSGLFTQYVAFDEATLATRSKRSLEEVYEKLKTLSSKKIISYIPKKQNPVITLLEERLDQKNIHISVDRYRFRKERYLERINEMLEYAESEHVCRSRFLLNYFGETDSKDCGSCDYCLEKKKSGRKSDQNHIKAKVIGLLEEGPLGLKELTDKCSLEENQIAMVLEELIEENIVLRNPDLKFVLKQS